MFRALPSIVRHATRRTINNTTQRRYASQYEERRDKTLKTSSKLTWTLVPAASIAGIAYQYWDFESNSSQPGPSKSEKIEHEKHSDLEAPKPVEDRHGDTVAKHSIAAHKNQHKVREGVFNGKEFDNHELKHSGGNPDKDFEKKK
ncbi:hypothetical protein BU23DRAFT_524818 [Bimuria novae-zelandiae CBS 107.79]|uniref:Uncharacterized protein n=1 Tax=Bimuria novae-zelandiae CBS 107.79 TaxID=1447943 RepID=A0A6A5VP68_9PLEO|nr:hypothetical protein BU23DRAFT_524818 [Bimuria novae-zelandiae CBS 107.79]